MLLSVCPSISPYNILVASPAVSKSHFNVGEAIAIGLSNAGHNVTLISPFDYKPKNRNIEHVQTTGAVEKAEGKFYTLLTNDHSEQKSSTLTLCIKIL